MSEEINFQFASGFLQMLKEKGKAEVEVKVLPNSLRRVAEALGYGEEDTVPVKELEEYIQRVGVTNDTPVTSLHADTSEDVTDTNPVTPVTFSENDHVTNTDDLKVWLEAIGKTLPKLNRLVKRLAAYILIKNSKVSEEELRQELYDIGKSLFNKEYTHESIRQAISAVKNSGLVLMKKDPNTGIIYWRPDPDVKAEILKTYEILKKEQEVLQKQEELKQADRERLIEAVVDFYENVYKQHIVDLKTLIPKKFLTVDWQELRSYNPELAEYVVYHPVDAINVFETALLIFQRDYLFVRPAKFNVHFTNVGDPVRVKDLRDGQFGQMVTVRAMVSGVTSKKKLFYKKMVVVCRECGWEKALVQDPIAKVEWPLRCEACGSRNLKVDEKKSEVRDIVFFTLQDMVEDLENKEQPLKVSAYMLRPHVSLAPGDRVLVTGVLRDTVHRERKQLSDVVLEVLHVEFLDDVGIGELSEEDIVDIKKLKEKYGDDLPDAVARSLAPQIFADPELLPELWFFKKAVVYAIASPKELGPGDERLWIHVLAVGDKGTGKSRIIRDIKNVTVAVYGEGGNVSGAGLIGMPEREELTGEWVFRGGLMVRANGFVLALDEFEKAKPDDYARMHGGMSYGTVDFSKASISTTLKTMESVVAVANPIGGYFNGYKKVFEQITLPSSLLDRFDVIFILRQPMNEQVIEAIYDHQDKFEVGEVQREIPEELLRKFFLYVRELKPIFTKEARKEIKRFGMMVNKALVNAGFKYSMRLRGILKRLAMANAQLRLSEKVELKDVIAAEEVFTAAIRSWGDGDIDWSVFGEIEAQASREELELLRKVEDIFERLHEYYQRIPEREVLEALEDRGLDREKARYALELAKERNVVVEREDGWILASRA